MTLSFQDRQLENGRFSTEEGNLYTFILHWQRWLGYRAGFAPR